MDLSGENIKLAISELRVSKANVNQLLGNYPMLQIRANNVLETLINGLCHTIGAEVTIDGQAGNATFKHVPITGGLLDMKAKPVSKEPISSMDLQPKEDDIADLKLRAKEAYDSFLTRESKDLVDSLRDIEVRAVAKLAGLEISLTEPKTITVPFIDKIKAAIASKKSIEEAKAKATTPKTQPKK
jgi:hypothetical protein